jgi:predicted metalloprotease
MVPLAASPSTGPIVCPASVDTLVQIQESFWGEETKNSNSHYV